MDNQKENSSEVKTHEEILRLFKDLDSLEAKVKNPEVFKGQSIESESFLQDTELPTQNNVESDEEPPSIEPSGEILLEKKDKKKTSFLEKKEKREKQSKKKIKWFTFQKKEKNNQPEHTAPAEIEQHAQEVKIPQSTFILQLDSDGHLVGLPIKKSKPEQAKKGWFSLRGKSRPDAEVNQEAEPVKGIKGKLLRVLSGLRQKKSLESESGGGIGDKIKGLFKRKSNE
ncbi:MAG TPA: hypothetical protein VMY59_00440 [Candidatus Thermoplasmatota archaeon]|nr:hypothetical protein [Candidatus Thermoplasmatota archaeon]